MPGEPFRLALGRQLAGVFHALVAAPTSGTDATGLRSEVLARAEAEDEVSEVKDKADEAVGMTGNLGTMQATIVRRVDTVIDRTVLNPTYHLRVPRTTQMRNTALSQGFIAK